MTKTQKEVLSEASEKVTSKLQFICKAVKWFDKVNGNTYHSVKVTRCSDGAIVTSKFDYGYGEQYKQSAYCAMEKAGWLPKEYTVDNAYKFERENEYPIEWIVTSGLKRECIANGNC